MNIREGQNSRRVSFAVGENLGDMIDKLVDMIGKLVAKELKRLLSFLYPSCNRTGNAETK